jgi:hypothetical protein
MVTVALRGKEAFWDLYPDLCGDLKPCSSCSEGCQSERGHTPDDAIVAGRTGQQYNQRKNRKGAFWEDRYHATAVEADSHLSQCMVSMLI